MSATFVPAVDRDGEDLWLSPDREVVWLPIGYVPVGWGADLWQRLHVPVGVVIELDVYRPEVAA